MQGLQFLKRNLLLVLPPHAHSKDGFRKIKEARASGSEYSWTAEEARSAVLYVPPPSIARVLGDDSRFSAAEAAVQPLPPWTLLSCELGPWVRAAVACHWMLGELLAFEAPCAVYGRSFEIL